MLEIRDLTVFIARTTVLHDVSLKVPSGQTAGLIGRNGAGKTTLMRSIMGLIPFKSGRIIFNGEELGNKPAHRRVRHRIGYMPEDRRLVPEFTVEDNILLPVWAGGTVASTDRLEWIYELMPEIAQFSSRRALQLSGGQQKLAALARALMCGTELLLLDEPFEGVAPALSQRLMEVIANLKAEGLSVLLSESDYTHSVDLLDHLFVIERGAVAEQKMRT
jgi:branched-chain amino acid transport system ATP-binding protein